MCLNDSINLRFLAVAKKKYQYDKPGIFNNRASGKIKLIFRPYRAKLV